jgi:uncharacterized protein (UPF0548 family)
MAGMGRRHRLATALTWPVGIALTSWAYMWRTTPVHRRERSGSAPDDGAPELPPRADEHDLQPAPSGVGPLFHRRYRTRIRDANVTAEELVARLSSDVNAAAPTSFARFVKTRGAEHTLAVGDEFVVRMPGPWDGPVRVLAVGPTSFRLATLDGHLEAGQIEFRASQGELLEFEIESWARSGDRLSNLLYHHLRMAKEIQLHMWISFLERVVGLSGGRMTGGIDVETRRVESGLDGDDPLLGPPPIREALARLRHSELNFEPPPVDGDAAAAGWRVDDLAQALPPEPPGPPLEHGSFAVAQRLMRGYEFADPSIVRAYYDPSEPLERRTMLLEVRFRALRFHIGVRVREVYDRSIERDGRPVRIWGWSYGTLRGHFEMGQMDWQVWKWLDTGEVEFRIHAYSRRAPVTNPLVRAGFRLVGRREQLAFLHSTMRRMATLTRLRLEEDADAGTIRETAEELTARGGDTGAAHDELVRNLEGGARP